MLTSCYTILLIVTGLAGSGKSFLAKRMSLSLKWPYLDYDDINEPFLEEYLAHNFAGSYEQAMRETKESSYSILWQLSKSILESENSLIVAAPFSKIRYEERGALQQFKATVGTPIRVVEIHLSVPQKILKSQIEERALPRDSEKLTNWHHFIGQNSKREPVWKPDLLINATHDDKEKDYDNFLARFIRSVEEL